MVGNGTTHFSISLESKRVCRKSYTHTDENEIYPIEICESHVKQHMAGRPSQAHSL